MTRSFRALVLRESEGKVRHAFEQVSEDALPEGDVTVSVTHSSLNYKDGLAVTGRGKIARRFPMVPGIDLAGVVERSESPDWKPGDEVLATGWEIGEAHWGGYAEKARVRSEWLVRLPEGLTREQAMAIGTAGLTSSLSVLALEDRGLEPGAGPMLVTGSTGGVGSLAVALLAARGHEVTASTGRPEHHGYLRELGATEVLERGELSREARPLESEVWAGAVDTVGGRTLATAFAQMRRGAGIAVCGLVESPKLETTVFPLILRGVALLGIDSNLCPRPRRRQAWERLARDLDRSALASMTRVIGLDEVPEMAAAIVAGKVRGRIVVDLGR